jgi:glycosyltransferase involved in cell wall biosynthesis
MIYYFDYPLGQTITGANLFYTEIARILSSFSNARRIKGRRNFLSCGIRHLKPNDTLIANDGPYAFIYHYLRKRNGQRFRIVRDVQTTLHASNLFQELACSELQLAQDTVLFPSNYTRNLYIEKFSHLTDANTLVCYPMRFPKLSKRNPRQFTAGFLGRCTEAKGFHHVLSIAPRLPGRVLVAGELFCPASSLPSNVTYLGQLPPSSIWKFMRSISVLLFPSTANIESLGRVVLEATAAGVPVVGARFGATPELTPCLASVVYTGKEVELVHTNPLGAVDEDELLALAINPKPGSNQAYIGHDRLFISLLHGNVAQKRAAIHPEIADFISKTKIYLNSEYKNTLGSAICRFIKLLQKEDSGNIGITSTHISEALNFIPTWKLNQTPGKPKKGS